MPRAAVPRFHGGTGRNASATELATQRLRLLPRLPWDAKRRPRGSLRRLPPYALCALCIPALKVRIDRTVRAGHQHPTWLRSPRRRVDRGSKIVGEIEYL